MYNLHAESTDALNTIVFHEPLYYTLSFHFMSSFRSIYLILPHLNPFKGITMGTFRISVQSI